MNHHRSSVTTQVVLLLCCMAVLSGQESQQQRTSTITGTITAPLMDELTQEILRGQATSRYTNKTHGKQHPTPYTLSEKIVIYLESESADLSTPAAEYHARLDQRDMMFWPLVLPILVGTTVDFPNNDDVFHNVFSYSLPKDFDLGRYPKGKNRSVRFDKPGIVKIYCDIHAYMYATILVLTNPHFTTPTNDGRYEIPNVPEGTYTLHFWLGRNNVETKTITVKAGEIQTVNFSY